MMGLCALVLSGLLLRGNVVRKQPKPADDAEKAVHNGSEHSPANRNNPASFGLGHDDSDDDDEQALQDMPSADPPHPRISRSPSDPTLFARIKAYVWPSDDQLVDIDAFVPDYRWTPIISGILIPFSILLEIPGLTQRWYIRTEDHKTVETRPNPVLLDVGLAFSIGCALIANVGLVLRFLEKRVQTVTLLCIVFLTIHDIINIIAVTVFGIEHRFDDGFTYGEAFWMTLCSTIASTVTNVSLIVDFVRTPDFAKRGSGLTRKQRALMIIVIVLLIYIALGAFINSVLLHLSFIDGLYFTVVSIETIAFGDIVPTSTGARVWTCVYIVFGIINIGVAIAMCRETILEGLEIGYRRRMRDLRQRRRDAQRFREWETRWQRAVEFRLREAGQPVWVPDTRPTRLRTANEVPNGGMLRRLPFFKRVGATITHTAAMTSVESVFGGRRNHHLNVDALTAAQLEEAALEAGVPLDMFLETSAHRHQNAAYTTDQEDDHQAEDLPVHSQTNRDIVPALAQTHATYAFHDNISSGWPSHPETPTHAQLGRMSAMLTKFAVAVSGSHAHAPRAERVDQRHTNPGTTAGTAPPDEHVHDDVGSDSGRPRHGHHRPSLPDIRSKHPGAKWLKDFSRGANQRSSLTYEKFMAELETEEKKAYYVKLTIAWTLFFLFWTIGSGIFAATEGWSYGIAMYFCFVAFSTTGYGDFAPQTPAGRSVFVVWALFGVGTMTILVSVVQEAGSSRYKNALHSHVFDKAVKKYRKKELQDGKQRPRPIFQEPGISDHAERSMPHGDQPEDQHAGPSAAHTDNMKPTNARLNEAHEVSRKALEALPGEIVRMSRIFRNHMQFFAVGRADGINPIYEPDDEEGERGEKLKVPPEMRKLLDELAEMEGINERVKAEILQDQDARKTLFVLSLERSLKRLVTSAEKALSALADRDALATIDAAGPPQRSSASTSSRRPPSQHDR